MSYFPISLPRAERQLRLQADYGFACKCARPCKLARRTGVLLLRML